MIIYIIYNKQATPLRSGNTMRILGGGGARFLIIEKDDVEEVGSIPRSRRYLEDGGYVEFTRHAVNVYGREGFKHRIDFPVWFNCDPEEWTVSGRFALVCELINTTTTFLRINLDTKEVERDSVSSDITWKSGWGKDNIPYYMDGEDLRVIDGKMVQPSRYRIPNMPKAAIVVRFIFDGNESMLVAARSKIYTDIFSFKVTEPGEWKHLTKFEGISGKFKLHMATPTLLYVEDLLTAMAFSYNLLTGDQRSHPEVDFIVFSPDGRYILRLGQDKDDDIIEEVSQDGSRFYRKELGDDDEYYEYREMTLKKPLPYPVYTQFYESGRWVRVMSNNTFESSESWGTGRELKTYHLKGTIPFAAWISRPEGVDTMKKAKEIYLMELAKALARAIK